MGLLLVVYNGLDRCVNPKTSGRTCHGSALDPDTRFDYLRASSTSCAAVGHQPESLLR